MAFAQRIVVLSECCSLLSSRPGTQRKPACRSLLLLLLLPSPVFSVACISSSCYFTTTFSRTAGRSYRNFSWTAFLAGECYPVKIRKANTGRQIRVSFGSLPGITEGFKRLAAFSPPRHYSSRDPFEFRSPVYAFVRKYFRKFSSASVLRVTRGNTIYKFFSSRAKHCVRIQYIILLVNNDTKENLFITSSLYRNKLEYRIKRKQ